MPIYKTAVKKDGKQQYRVHVNFTDQQGKYRQKTKLVYGAAEAKLAEMELQKETGETMSGQCMTVNELFDEYICAKKSEVRESTLDKSSRTLKDCALPYLGAEKLRALTTPKIQKWKNQIAERDLSITTKNNYYKELHTLLNFAVKMGYIGKNPLNAVGRFRDAYFKPKKEALHYYTAEQFAQFAKAAKTGLKSLTEHGYMTFFYIAFYTGMRKGEINALKWSDIEGDIIHVRRSVNLKLGGVTETPPKNKSSYRDLQIPEPLQKILAEQKERQQIVKSFSDDFRVCGGIKCLSDTGIRNFYIKVQTLAGLPAIRIHDFRHTHATLLINEGISIQEIARRLGHSNVEITWKVYAHLYPREEERAIKILNSITA